MSCETVHGSAAMRRLIPAEPDADQGWALQIGVACTGAVPFDHWRCVLRFQEEATELRSGGGTATRREPGTWEVRPINGTVTPGNRASVALRVTGTDSAPSAVQFYAFPLRGTPLLLRCDTVAVRLPDNTTRAADHDTWPGSTAMGLGRAALAPWHDWAEPLDPPAVQVHITGGAASAYAIGQQVQRALNRPGSAPRRATTGGGD